MDNDYISLSHRVVFYVPSTIGPNTVTATALTARTQEIAELLTAWFGGASIEKVQGFYKMATGEYTTEAINKVVSFCADTDLEQHLSQVLNLAHAKKEGWEQETIGVEVDTKFFLID